MRGGRCLFDWVGKMGRGGEMNLDKMRISTLHAGRINIMPNTYKQTKQANENRFHYHS